MKVVSRLNMLNLFVSALSCQLKIRYQMTKYLCKFQFDKSWFANSVKYFKEIEYDQDIKKFLKMI